jgi:ABC-type antimicrobial peptide transport system permease subunit
MMSSPFSVDSIAIANLRSRRKQYRLLITGIVLAIYFVATTLLFAATMFASLKEQHYQLVGKQDAIIFNCQDAPLEELLENGVFSEYGTAEIVGYVLPDGQDKASGFSIARFDETAVKLAGKEAVEGRLPNKAGEIALERSTLARLRSEAGVGDTITLTLLIPDGTDFLDSPIQKTFTLVGILSDKLAYLNQYGFSTPAYHDYPAGVLSADEPIAPGGKEIVNCYGYFAQSALTSYEQLKSFCEKKGIINDYGWVNTEITRYPFFDSSNIDKDNIIFTSAFFMIIALILMCAACLGIVNSFTASLESRKRQIGLLRAVGATKKQIRQIFGRETLLLAVFSIPPGLLLACLTVWAITKLLGPDYIFHLNALIMVGVAAAGVLCVLLAASIPLRRAAKIPPMQAIQDVELSRRMKKSTVKSERFFKVSRHIAHRNLTLYKNKQLMFTAVLVVSIMLLSLLVFAATPLLKEADADYGSDYRIFQRRGSPRGWFVEHEFHKPGITEQDKADVAALPTVKTAIGAKVLTVKILTNQITPYMAGISFKNYGNLPLEIIEETAPELLTDIPESLRQDYQRQEDSIYEQSKTKYGYTQDYLTVDCCGTDAELVEKLSPFVSEGRIDTDKLSSGEEILLIAPAEYGIYIHQENDEYILTDTDYVLDENKTYAAVFQNNTFHAGDLLTISLLYSDELEQYDEEGNPKLPDEVVRIDKTVTIGAILEITAGEKNLYEYFSSSFYPEVGAIITTTTGLDALGFDRPYDTLSITLTESPDPAMEEYLDTKLAQIAARTAGVDLISYVALTKENRKLVYGLLIASGALIILFFAICASMVNNTLSARILASKREIGTIRAVGASEREILHSYLWQLVYMFSWGTIIGLAAELAVCSWLLAKEQIPAGITALPIWQPLLFVALLFVICFLNVRSKVGAIFRGSIVENIREL